MKHAGGGLAIISEVIILIGEVVAGINVELIELEVKRWHGKETLLIGKWGVGGEEEVIALFLGLFRAW
jgi:hypothetical protein